MLLHKKKTKAPLSHICLNFFFFRQQRKLNNMAFFLFLFKLTRTKKPVHTASFSVKSHSAVAKKKKNREKKTKGIKTKQNKTIILWYSFFFCLKTPTGTNAGSREWNEETEISDEDIFDSSAVVENTRYTVLITYTHMHSLIVIYIRTSSDKKRNSTK